MLTRLWLVAVAAGILLSASDAVAKASIDAAFGLPFGKPLDRTSLGASVEPPPLDAADVAVLYAAIEVDSATNDPHWYHVKPAQTPRVLRNVNARYFAQTNGQGRLLVVLAVLGAQACDLAASLGELVTKKYGQEPENQPISSIYEQIHRWQVNGRMAVSACSGHSSWLAYADPAPAKRWRQELAAEEKEALQLEQVGHIVQANQFAHGNRRALEGGFGVLFAAPFPEFETLATDEPNAVALEGLKPPFDDGEFQLTVSPTGYPIRIAGTFNDGSLDWAAERLAAKFGTPSKRTPHHVIHKVGSDFVVLKQRSGRPLEVVFISGDGQKGQKARAKASAEADWQDEVDGL